MEKNSHNVNRKPLGRCCVTLKRWLRCCKADAALLQSRCSVAAKPMQRHCKADAASLQSRCSVTAKPMPDFYSSICLILSNRHRSLFRAFPFAALLFAGTACDAPAEEPLAAEEGKVRVELLCPGFYDAPGAGQGGVTRATEEGEDDCLPEKDMRHVDTPKYPVPAGSTLWLTYRKETEEGGVYEEKPDVCPYIVRLSGGYHALFPCGVKEGTDLLEIDTTKVSSPLYLEPGRYKFKMITPALPLKWDETDKAWKLQADNGMYFCATDGRYHETYSRPVEIEQSTTQLQYITLPAMVQQTARFHFVIEKDPKTVFDIRMMEPGLEISGLQNPERDGDRGGLLYHWSSEHIKDTLEMRIGDKRSWARIPGNSFTTDSEGRLTGHIGVLPADSRANPIVILMNMVVNGVPTQYETSLSGLMLVHARSYNLKATVSLQGNVVVMNWQNQSWNAEMELQ